MSYAVECASEDERKLVEYLITVMRRSRDQSVVTILRDGLTVRGWSNGQPQGRVRLNNLPPAWMGPGQV